MRFQKEGELAWARRAVRTEKELLDLGLWESFAALARTVCVDW